MPTMTYYNVPEPPRSIPWWSQSHYDGLDMYFDFTQGRYFDREDLPSLPSIGSMLTDTHAQQIYMQDESGLWVPKAANVPCIEAGVGLQTVPTSTRLSGYPVTPFTNWSAVQALKSEHPGTFFGIFEDAVTIASNGTNWHRIDCPATPELESGSTYGVTTIYKAGTSGRFRIQMISGNEQGSSISGEVGEGFSVDYENGGTYSNIETEALGDGWYRTTVLFTPNDDATYELCVGPASEVVGETVHVAGGWIESSWPSPPILATPASTATRNGNRQVVDLTGRLSDGVAGFIRLRPQQRADNSSGVGTRVLEFNDGTSYNRIYIQGLSTQEINIGGTSNGDSVGSMSPAEADWSSLGTLAFAFGSGFWRVQVVGMDGASRYDLGYPAATRLNLLGRGFDTAGNIYGLVERVGLRFGAVDQTVFDEMYAIAQTM